MNFRRHRRSNNQSRRRVRLRRRLVVEQLSSRRVLAAITGTVYEDLDQSFRQEPSEVALAHRLVYLDINENAAIDTGEPFALTDDAGGFAFTGLPDGQYQVRLYDGSTTQTQVTPIQAARQGAPIVVADAIDVATDGSRIALLTDSALTIGDHDSGTFSSVLISDSPTAVEQLPDGKFLVVGGNGVGDSAWLVDPADNSLTAIDLIGDGSATVWSDVVINDDGQGLLLQQTADATLVYSIDVADAEFGIVANDSDVSLPLDTQALTSDDGNRSLLAWAGQWTDNSGNQSGLQVALWSNATGSQISSVPTNLADATELLDYDDASGLAALRTSDGGVSVYDANADFSLLAALPDVTGPVAIDGPRDLLVTMSANTSTIRLIDAHDGSAVADFDVDAADLGSIGAIQVQSPNSIVLLGDKGSSRVGLSGTAANVVTLIGGSDSAPISFGVVTMGENTLPTFQPPPAYYTNEDESIFAPAPSALQAATDAEDDRVVLLMMAQASNGTAVVAVDGEVRYTPDANYYGVDTLPVILHDGRGASSIVGIRVDVSPVDDPADIILEVNEIAENLPVGEVIGPVVIVDVDGNENNELVVEDPRFQIIDGNLVFVGPGAVNFEREPFIEIGIFTSDYSSGVTQTLTVLDENDPIEAIEPKSASVLENDAGAHVAEILVVDEDSNDSLTVTVDDNRFVIDGLTLALAPGVSLDFEATPEVTVNVTATGPDGDSLTQPIVISVIDELEQVASIDLSDKSVVELEPGAAVGDVIVNGNPIGSGYSATVDDSRFEIDGSVLKLVDGQWVDRADQSEIELTIDVQDVGGEFAGISETFVISVLENTSPFQDPSNPFDVDGSGEVTPLDALIIINFITEHGVGEDPRLDPRFNVDVNGDGIVTPLDILLILNELDAIRQRERDTVAGEGTDDGSPLLPDDDVDDEDELPAEEITVNQASGGSGSSIQFSESSGGSSEDSDSDAPSDNDLTAQDFADGVDASLDSLLDEMS